MAQWHEDLISQERAHTLDGLKVKRRQVLASCRRAVEVRYGDGLV